MCDYFRCFEKKEIAYSVKKQKDVGKIVNIFHFLQENFQSSISGIFEGHTLFENSIPEIS